MKFKIPIINNSIRKDLIDKINNKTKPLGALGALEQLAIQVGQIQNTLEPKLNNPTIVVFASDHGIASEGEVNPFPQEVTWQMVFNFLSGGAAINVFARQNDIDVKIVDSGVNYDFENHPDLIHAKIAMGTRNYRYEKAMTQGQCELACNQGAKIVENLNVNGTNVIGFGEMGIGNTSSASLLMSVILKLPIEECVGKGTGLDSCGVERKKQILKEVIDKHGSDLQSPIDALIAFGGFEIAMIAGAILRAAELGMIILIDGFIVTAALLVASSLEPSVLGYCVFAHTSSEKGHELMLNHFKAKPLIKLQLRLGEGTGVAIAYPILKSSLQFLVHMASFEQAEVSNAE